jgi:hypothetical protein
MTSGLLVSIVLLQSVAASPLMAQNKFATPRSGPAPQVTGRVVEANQTQITIGYQQNHRAVLFRGTLQSGCSVPATGQSASHKELKLMTVPTGTRMTLFYVPRRVANGSKNMILAIRFDDVPRGSTLPHGISIPCFKPVGQTGKNQ